MVSENTGRTRDAARSAQARRTAKPKTKQFEDILSSVRTQLEDRKPRDARRLVQAAMVQFPDEPVLLSYSGYLQSLVERKYQEGINTCKKALVLLKKRIEFDDADFSVLYLNLGRAYALAKQRQDALDAFNRGLAYDSGQQDIRSELRSMGVRRKKPPLPFLQRKNPVNKLIGILLYRRLTV